MDARPDKRTQHQPEAFQVEAVHGVLGLDQQSGGVGLSLGQVEQRVEAQRVDQHAEEHQVGGNQVEFVLGDVDAALEDLDEGTEGELDHVGLDHGHQQHPPARVVLEGVPGRLQEGLARHTEQLCKYEEAQLEQQEDEQVEDEVVAVDVLGGVEEVDLCGIIIREVEGGVPLVVNVVEDVVLVNGFDEV